MLYGDIDDDAELALTCVEKGLPASFFSFALRFRRELPISAQRKQSKVQQLIRSINHYTATNQTILSTHRQKNRKLINHLPIIHSFNCLLILYIQIYCMCCLWMQTI